MVNNNTSNKQAVNDGGSSVSTSESDLSEEQEVVIKSAKSNRAKAKSESASVKEISTPKEKKRKKKKTVSICLTNCRYEVIRKVAQKFGLKETSESDNWNMYWTDLSISIERCKEMKRFQRINHFPGKDKDLFKKKMN